LSGGTLIVRPDQRAQFTAHEQIIAGNVIAYGATDGRIFASGMVGERCCVRNSGATVVVEGVGDHGCEYMTGGHAVVLGPVGRNFAAGMSGGTAFLLDANIEHINQDMVGLEDLDAEDGNWLAGIVAEHAEQTGSLIAQELLADWPSSLRRFAKVMPRDYRRVLDAIALAESEGRNVDEAIMEASRG
jgi:glutamate synthase (NADPH/NADH) large chain